MNRNQNMRFAMNPVNLDIGRSKFRMPHEVKLSGNVGDIIPFDVQEILPGDTFQIRTTIVARLQPLVSSPMDDLFLDTYYFFVPNRLVWKHWKEFMGENTESAWIPSSEYTIPQLKLSNGAKPGSILDYMGVPTKVSMLQERDLSISALPARAYALICNEWFRDENLSNPLNIYDDDTDRRGFGATRNGSISGEPLEADFTDPVIGPVLGGAPYKAAKIHDYFTSVLPGPQKGPDVSIIGDFPVYFGNPLYEQSSGDILDGDNLSYSSADQTTIYNYLKKHKSSGYVVGTADLEDTEPIGYPITQGVDGYNLVQPLNWFVSPNFSVNSMRLAFQIQKLYEKEARSGSRYIEILKGHFGVTAPDASLQRPQYLGGKRISININQVLQTSESGSTPQGNVAGYSLTADSSDSFVQSFTEHGYVIGLMVARYNHTYQQGLNRMWTRKGKLDYYFPVLANIGEQPVLSGEIFARGTDVVTEENYDDEVFGYQEAWADYRYRPNIVVGEMRSNVSNSLDSWHFADDYASLPELGDSWIREDKSNVDRVLAVSSEVSNQFFADVLIDATATRPMPLYSIPGLIDHH